METLIAGSYDRFLFGFECSTSGRDDEEVAGTLSRSFMYPAHKGPVKCVAAGLPYIASGGADDLIHLYDLKAGTDLGFLMSPGSGAVSALAWHTPRGDFPPTHLLSGAADGGISVWQAGQDWVCYKTLYSHKKEVTSIAVHSTGRLALSASRQNDLKLWNLVKGKCVHTSKLNATADVVMFGPDANDYMLLKDREVAFHSMEKGEQATGKLTHSRKLHCMAQAISDSNLILTGSEEGAVLVWDRRQPGAPALAAPRAHQSRVRGVVSLEQGGGNFAASASTDGVVKLWDLRKLEAKSSAGSLPISEANTAARLTCLSSIDVSKDIQPAPKVKKLKPPPTEEEKTKPARDNHKARKDQKEKRKVNHKEKTAKKDVSGIAHDGVVEFPDEDDKKIVRTSKAKAESQQANLPTKKRKVNKSHM